MWSTFDPQNATDPFHGMPNSARAICCLLGLPLGQPPYLQFEYALPDEIKPLYPTVAEAFSGQTWHVRFRPAPFRHAPRLDVPLR